MKAGILIAGSLYWSDRLHRVQWQKDHLRKNSEVAVKAPIRYGRLSSTRSYTMVFAPGCPLGMAKVLECVDPVNSIDDLIEEAQALWLAESPDGSPRRPTETLAADWGCVALLANPASNIPEAFLNSWAARVAKECHHRSKARSYDCQQYTVKGASAITDQGMLGIAWPVRADTSEPLGSLDLLLATATKPSPDKSGDYPTANQIAAAWIATGDASYFWKNREHGFHTFQDEEIEQSLGHQRGASG